MNKSEWYQLINYVWDKRFQFNKFKVDVDGNTTTALAKQRVRVSRGTCPLFRTGSAHVVGPASMRKSASGAPGRVPDGLAVLENVAVRCNGQVVLLLWCCDQFFLVGSVQFY